VTTRRLGRHDRATRSGTEPMYAFNTRPQSRLSDHALDNKHDVA